MADYFLLFGNCIKVKGASRSSICDLQEGRLKLIPNLLYEVLDFARQLPIVELKKHYDNKMDEGIEQYFSLLEKEGFGFYTSSPESFPILDMTWDSPSVITNCIIDIDGASDHPYKKIISELEILGCQALQIRLFDVSPLNLLDSILSETIHSRILSIELVLPYHGQSSEMINEICHKHRRIRTITLHSSLNESIETFDNLDVSVVYVKKRIDSEEHCGAINSNLFSSNIQLFTESQAFNSCLNRKISVDKYGEVKNCPSMKTSYGNINGISLYDAVKEQEFKKYWGIHKDQIAVCKDCEFRHVCTDCRAYLDERNLLSKPVKCTYDPYAMKWN